MSDEHEPKEKPSSDSREWGGDDSLMLFGVTALAAVTRIFRLGSPKRFIFDEVYYAKEACHYVGVTESLCRYPKHPPAEVHPPLAKWIMGLGVKVLGADPLGWRIAAAVFGVIGVILLFLLARKIFRSTLAAAVAAGLLAFDPLNFVQSRAALLDIFPATFGIAAFLFLAYDRDHMQKRAHADGKTGLLSRPWRLAAGLAAGAATASKWSGGLIFIAVILLTLVWEVGRRKEHGWGTALLQTLKQESLSIVLFLGALPFVLYVASYIGRLDGAVLQPLADNSWFRQWVEYQTNAFTFHRGLRSHHGYESPPISWIAMKRPLLYWSEQTGAQHASIYAFGNPLVWWPSVVALGYIFVRWLKNRDWSQPEGLILMGFATTYLAWVVLAPQRTAVFLFYMLPAIPFMCLAISYVVGVLAKGKARKVAVGLTILFSAGWFFAYYPIIANVPIPTERWDAQMFFSDCKVPPRRDVQTQTVTQAQDRQTTIVKTNVRTATSTKDIPPPGWCWR
ncbi:MAG TPA: phospholipid carrier-dependent glycosyltransferase [Actinomycetota bacterium]|nr:phospholipid carrier-dependent glycosyltransferase [Actinomycetota bacterium]